MKNPLNDERLRQWVRQGWTVSVDRDPGFRAAVWARIEARRRLPATWGAWLRLHLAGVVAGAAVVVLAAGAGGSLLASRQVEREREARIQRYVASIDPHQRVHADSFP